MTANRPAVPRVAVGAGALLVVVGLAAFRWLPGEPVRTSVAISRYSAPLPTVISFPVSVWTPHQVVAAAVCVAGVLLIAVVIGYGRGHGHGNAPAARS